MSKSEIISLLIYQQSLSGGEHVLYGLSSAEALQRLHDELVLEIRVFESKRRQQETIRDRFRKHFLYPYQVSSVFHLTSAILIAGAAVALLFAYALQQKK